MIKAGIALAILTAVLVGCQHFKDTVGCYAHTDMELGYAHNFGDSNGGGFSGDLATVNDHPAHGGSSISNFRYDQSDQFSEDRIDTKVTLRFAPGSCK